MCAYKINTTTTAGIAWFWFHVLQKPFYWLHIPNSMIADKVQMETHTSLDCWPLVLLPKPETRNKKTPYWLFWGIGWPWSPRDDLGATSRDHQSRATSRDCSTRNSFFPEVGERFLPAMALSKRFCAALGAVILSHGRAEPRNPCRTAQGICWQSRGFMSVR